MGIRANAIAPGAVEGDRIERVFAGRAQIGGRTVEKVRAEAMAAQSIKAMIKPTDIAALAVFLASDAAKCCRSIMIGKGRESYARHLEGSQAVSRARASFQVMLLDPPMKLCLSRSSCR
jgi:hypothetical protein